MIDLLQRAEALKSLIDSGASDPARRSLEEALVSCCERLVEPGEVSKAIELVRAWDDRFPRSVRIAVVLARALTITENWDSCLALVHQIFRDEREQLTLNPREGYLLRIYEATCFRAVNRVEESVANLIVLRNELLAQP